MNNSHSQAINLVQQSNSLPSGTHDPRLATRLRKLWTGAVRKWTVYGLFAIVVAGRFVPFLRGDVQIVCLSAIGGLLLFLLFDMRSKLGESRLSAWFSNFQDAAPSMENSLAEGLRSNSTLTIQWIGVTLRRAWPFLEEILEKALEEGGKCQVDLELACIDPKLSPRELSGSPYPQYAASSLEAIEHFKKRNQKQLDERGWNISIQKYTHLPNINGLLINGSELFMGICSWKNNKLYVAEGPYDRISGTDSISRSKISEFLSWIRFCASSNSQDRQAS